MKQEIIEVGDLVKPSPLNNNDSEWAGSAGIGIVLEVGMQMWGEDVIPSGVRVLWQNTMEIEIGYEDELEIVEKVQKKPSL